MPPDPKMRVILDTNLFVGYFLGQHVRERLERLLFDPSVELFICQALLDEIGDVLSRPKFHRSITPDQIEKLLDLLRSKAKIVEIESIEQLSRDPDDDFLLALCRAAEADFLLTGDQDLLVLDPFERTRILTIAEFFAIL